MPISLMEASVFFMKMAKFTEKEIYMIVRQRERVCPGDMQVCVCVCARAQQVRGADECVHHTY